MSLAQGIALVLAIAAAVALARIAWRWRARRQATSTAAGPAIAWLALLALQPVLAWTLWQALYPPAHGARDAELVVATAGTRPADVLALGKGARVVALPEAAALPGAERVPDLASALRARPASALRMLGQGLAARDRDAVGALPVQFSATPLPRGLVALWRDELADVGRPFRVAGEVAGLAGGRVELRDPAGRLVDRASPGADGRFALQGVAPVAGALAFTLVVRDARQRVLSRDALPMQVREGVRPRLLVLAGGPDPDLKYLRRWAADAGFDLRARIALGAGVQVGEGEVALDAEALRAADLLVLDERAWRGLDAGRRASLRAAVRDGLGLLLRATGSLDADTRAAWRAFGLPLVAARVPDTVQLPADWLTTAAGAGATPAADTMDAAGADADARGLDDSAWPSRQPLAIDADAGARVLLADAQGRAVGAWRAAGAGRVGVLWLGDSYRLVLAGEGRAHARLWSDVVAALMRPRGATPPRLIEGPARVGERSLLCAARGPWRVTGPDGADAPLAIAPRGDESCASWWPARAGWHTARAGDGTRVLDVLPTDALPGLRARADRDATQALAARASAGVATRATQAEGGAPASPGARWPWALAWLALALAGWLLEWRVLAPAAPVVER